MTIFADSPQRSSDNVSKRFSQLNSTTTARRGWDQRSVIIITEEESEILCCNETKRARAARYVQSFAFSPRQSDHQTMLAFGLGPEEFNVAAWFGVVFTFFANARCSQAFA